MVQNEAGIGGGRSVERLSDGITLRSCWRDSKGCCVLVLNVHITHLPDGVKMEGWCSGDGSGDALFW